MKLQENATQAEREEFLKKLKLKLEKLYDEWNQLFDETYERDVHPDEFDELEKEIDRTKFGIQLASYKQ